ncbi:MAG: hypothetical protein M3529_08170 [Actinomycetota bacterium]|jgi:hypothetical protein|nr:hypothetical protein [Actinomycetota bacterium]
MTSADRDRAHEPSVWCPRCGDPIAIDDDGSWACSRHGRVPPLSGFKEPSVFVLLEHATRTRFGGRFPTWLPWPLPTLWSVSGVGVVGDQHTVATVLACSGPDPLGGAGDLVVVAEEPRTGLGAHYAGIAGLEPDGRIFGRAADAKVVVSGHPTPLWHVEAADDRAVYVGEASGCWLWVVGWPGLATAAVLLEATTLVDLSSITAELDVVPLNGLCPRLLSP